MSSMVMEWFDLIGYYSASVEDKVMFVCGGEHKFM